EQSEMTTTKARAVIAAAIVIVSMAMSGAAWVSSAAARAAQQPAATANARAARVDPYADLQRVVVMTDIANEPDDQMSMVRFLLYSNQFDIEGLVATTSTWMRNKVRPDV